MKESFNFSTFSRTPLFREGGGISILNVTQDKKRHWMEKK
jgi:hypothetical protein